MNDLLVSDFLDSQFQAAFKAYFAELGIHVKDWDGLFREMTEDSNWAYVRVDEQGQIVGFIQFKPITLSNWFFEEKAGFIREFWIAETYRGKGHGSELLKKTETFFAQQRIHRVILTTDTAVSFYEKHGYQRNASYSAKNHDDVFIKQLTN